MHKAMILKTCLAQLMRDHNMTVATLSRKASVPKQNIYNWLQGLRPKNIDQVKRVADVFSVSLDYLIYGSELRVATVFEELRDEIDAGEFHVILKRVKSENR